MLRPLILTSVIFAAVSAVEEQHCCAPSKFKAVLLQVSGFAPHGAPHAHMIKNQLDMHFNYEARMVVTRWVEGTGHASIIWDYRNSKLHYISAVGSCHTHYLNPALLLAPCEMGNFTHFGGYEVGSPGHTIDVNGIYGPVANFEMVVIYTSDCFPVAVSMWGENEQKTTDEIHNFLYTNITLNVVDEDLFKIPSNCGTPSLLRRRDIDKLRHISLLFQRR